MQKTKSYTQQDKINQRIGAKSPNPITTNLPDVVNNLIRLSAAGATPKNLLTGAANFRRAEIESQLFNRFEGLIQEGIFKGVRLSPPSPHGSVHIPKILGTYEAEIATSIKMLTEKSKVFIDIGCADGYYTSGIAVSTDVEKVVGVDICNEILEFAKESANINNISHKCIFEKQLANALPHIQNDSFIMIDVDGSEKEVLNELSSYVKANQLRRINILIETDFDSNGRSNRQELIDQMTKLEYKITETIDCNPVCTARFSPIARQLYASYLDQMICALERGYSNQSWIIAAIN